MKTVQLVQGSDDWMAWRRTCVTASDASSIMECNPYCDLIECRLAKLGLLPEKPYTDAMRRGHELEPKAREYYNNKYKTDFTPAVVESSEYPFLGASLDGINNDHKSILEIKCGVKSHELAKIGEIPPYYFCQIQHQLICTRAEICYYLSYQSDDNAIVIEVHPDTDFEQHYIPLAEKFWMDLIFKPPEIFKEKNV